jgi:hypothetical protein
MTRRYLTAGAAAVSAVLLGAAPAVAGNAHFIANHTKASTSGTSLVVSFKEAGLESGSVQTIQATAHLDATYQCINGGGNNPADPKKTTISQDVSQSGQFTAAKNGNVIGSLTLDAPAPATVLDCPGGQQSKLTVVTWSDLVVNDLSSGASIAVAGTWSAGERVGRGKG